jgi:hypothetical protein
MKPSGFGIASCIVFVGALALGVAGWVVVRQMPSASNHMDMGAGFQKLLVTGGFMSGVAIVQVVGVVLGVAGLRQRERSRMAAQCGVALNALGLFVVVALLVVAFVAA